VVHWWCAIKTKYATRNNEYKHQIIRGTKAKITEIKVGLNEGDEEGEGGVLYNGLR